MSTSNDAVEALVTVAKTQSFRFKLRVAAIEGLGYAGGFVARTALLEFLHNEREPELQEVAAVALGHASRE